MSLVVLLLSATCLKHLQREVHQKKNPWVPLRGCRAGPVFHRCGGMPPPQSASIRALSLTSMWCWGGMPALAVWQHPELLGTQGRCCSPLKPCHHDFFFLPPLWLQPAWCTKTAPSITVCLFLCHRRRVSQVNEIVKVFLSPFNNILIQGQYSSSTLPLKRVLAKH